MIKLYHRSFKHTVYTVGQEHRKQYRRIEAELTAQVKKDYPGARITLFGNHCFTDLEETIVCFVFSIEDPVADTKAEAKTKPAFDAKKFSEAFSQIGVAVRMGEDDEQETSVAPD